HRRGGHITWLRPRGRFALTDRGNDLFDLLRVPEFLVNPERNHHRTIDPFDDAVDQSAFAAACAVFGGEELEGNVLAVDFEVACLRTVDGQVESPAGPMLSQGLENVGPELSVVDEAA